MTFSSMNYLPCLLKILACFVSFPFSFIFSFFVCVHMCVHACVCTCACFYVHKCLCMGSCICLCASASVCMCACVHVCMCVYMLRLNPGPHACILLFYFHSTHFLISLMISFLLHLGQIIHFEWCQPFYILPDLFCVLLCVLFWRTCYMTLRRPCLLVLSLIRPLCSTE